MIRKNQGRESGASQPHLHQQIIGSPEPFPALLAESRAERGHQMNIVHEVVADSKLGEATTALAEKIAANAPLSLRAMKATVRRCMSETFDAWHDDMLKIARSVRESSDAKEGVRAFLEKRKPVWKAQ